MSEETRRILEEIKGGELREDIVKWSRSLATLPGVDDDWTEKLIDRFGEDIALAMAFMIIEEIMRRGAN